MKLNNINCTFLILALAFLAGVFTMVGISSKAYAGTCWCEAKCGDKCTEEGSGNFEQCKQEYPRAEGGTYDSGGKRDVTVNCGIKYTGTSCETLSKTEDSCSSYKYKKEDC